MSGGGRGGVPVLPAVAGMAMVGVVLAALGWQVGRLGVNTGPIEYDVGLPDSAGMTSAAQDIGFDVSAEAGFVVYETIRHGKGELWYRSLRDGSARRIPGSEGGSQPVLSPDGRRVAFFRLGEGSWTVEVLPVEGGTSTSLGSGVGVVRKLSWPRPDGILLLQSDANSARWYDPDRGAGSALRIPYCEAPAPIAGTDDVMCGGGGYKWAYRVTLGDSVSVPRLWHAEDSARVFGTSFKVVDNRYLTYVNLAGDLLAAPLDGKTGRVGRAVRMARGLRLADYTGNAGYSIAASGTLVYAQGDNKTIGHIVRVTDRGIDTLPVGRDAFLTFEISPDQRRLAAVAEGLDGMELRIYDLSTGRFQTWVRRPMIAHPVWSPEGDRVMFSVMDSMFVGTPDRADPPGFLFRAGASIEAMEWMAGGQVIALLYPEYSAVSFRPAARPITLDTLLYGVGFTFPSPDGRWIAYVSSNWTETWIEPFPRDGHRFQVASGNLADFQWLSPTELALPITDQSRTHIERVSIETGANPPARLQGHWADAPDFRDTNGPSFARAPGGGLLYLMGAVDRPASYLHVVPNWVRQMKQDVDAANR